MKALSIRQPWAWLIVNGHKNIENRDWRAFLRGEILIHAAKGMTRDEYEECWVLAHSQGVKLPVFEDLERGGIVGRGTIVDCVTDSPSPWFFGRFGFVLADVQPLAFHPLKGALGFFNVPPDDIRSLLNKEPT